MKMNEHDMVHLADAFSITNPEYNVPQLNVTPIVGNGIF